MFTALLILAIWLLVGWLVTGNSAMVYYRHSKLLNTPTRLVVISIATGLVVWPACFIYEYLQKNSDK